MSGSESVCVVAKHEKRGRRMKKHSQTLPLELIREILLRLPVRSVLRFKCVCKSWLSLISDPQFGISHYDLVASPIYRLILRSNDYYTESIDVDASLKEYSSCAVHLVLPPPSPPAPPKPWEDYYYANYYNHRETLGSCRGLLVLYYERTCDLILWNPSIGAHKRLPNFFVNEMTCLLYGFGYDTSTDDYLLILIELHESENEESENDECKLEIFILSFRDNWLPSKEIHASYKDLGSEFRAGSLLNEALHWFVFSEDNNVPVIIAFDLVQRSLSEIPLIDHLTMENYEAYSLRVMEGCLSVCCFVRGSKRTEIWVMKEYKVQSSWTKFVVIPTRGDYYRDRFSPICITKDGGIFGSNFCGKLEKLNDKGKLLEDLIYDGGQGLYTANKQSSTYRESLLSLPSVFWETRDDDHGETSEHDPNGETSEDENGETSEDDQ